MYYWTKKLLTILFVSIIFTTASWAQSVIKGQVKDSSGQPLVGATVIEDGTHNGVTTDLDGNFSPG